MPVPTGFSPTVMQKTQKTALGSPKTIPMREIFTHHA
jgi:hypothetical protein